MLAADLRDLLIADHATDSILRFDGKTGASLGTFISSGSGGLVNPHNPTFGPDGDLFVFSTQPGAEKILRYDGVTGAFESTFVNTGSGGFAGGFRMAFGPNDDLYVATGGANVLRYDGDTGAFVGIAASGNGITRASGVEFGPDGNLYVLDSDLLIDSAYDRILRFHPDTGAFIDVFAQPGSLEDAISFTFGPDGHLYVPDLSLEQTRVFNGTTGALQQIVPTPPGTSDVFDFVWGSDGNAYSASGDHILRFDGETLAFTGTFVENVGGSVVFFPSAEPMTDLEVTALQIPVGVVQAAEFDVTYQVRNNAAVATAAETWVDVLYLSADDVWDSSDQELARVPHSGSLAAGVSYTETLSIPLLNVSLGDYRIFVVADRRGEVVDSNRLNNRRISTDTFEVFANLATSHEADTSIAVGRTLSAYTTADIVGNQLTVTYTVYNLTDGYAQDVSLRTVLAAGVTFQSSTATATQAGQELTWNLGTLAPFLRASVSVTVTLAPGVTQIDLGPQAFAAIDTVAMEDDLGPAVLRTGAIDPALLAATIDADGADPFIQAKAAELNQDAVQILQYLAQEVGFESYAGSLRGARGTLWSSAGNALDEASLGVALLRASGIPARYVAGTLSDPLAQELILSMFPDTFQVVGSVPAGATVSDPANDPRLLAETRLHYWIQYDAGSGFVNADTTFADALPGETFTASTGMFTEVADALRHKVTVRLNAESYLAASGLFGGGGLSQQTVLQQTFAAVELVGRPLSIGFLVNESTLPNPLYAYQTITYSPYFVVAGDTYDARNEPLIHGTPFQEVLTSFPLGSQILTGMFADMEVTAPGGETQTYQSTILDRIGIAARQGGATVSVSADPGPALTPLHVTTINFLPGKDDPTRHRRARADMEAMRADLDALNRQALEGSAVVSLGHPLITASLIASSRLRLAHFLALSDGTIYDAASDLGVKAYYDSPRISIIRMSGGTDLSELTQALDLRNNVLRTLVSPGQNMDAQLLFELVRGEVDTFLEAAVFSTQSEPTGPLSLNGVVSAHRIFEAAVLQDIPLVLLQPGDTQKLDGLELGANAEVLITTALAQGRLVVVPQQRVLVDGASHIAWFETDPTTGETIGVLEDGGHQAISSYAAAISLGFKAGIAFNIVSETASIILSSLHQKNAGDILSALLNAGGPLGTAAKTSFAPGLLPIFAVSAFTGFVISAFISYEIKLYLASLGIPDPAVSPYLMSPPIADVWPTTRGVVTVSKPATLPGEAITMAGSVPVIAATQNTPAVFEIVVQTSLSDDYTLVAEAPRGWQVSLDAAGTVTAVPAPGLQAGSYSLHLFARSVSNPNLLAHSTVTVNITPTVPELDLNVVRDDLFFVAVDGGQLPSVFKAEIRNLGPTPESISITFANFPDGFEAVATRDQVTVPAGETGIVGFHLQPTGPLPAPGTVLNFDVIVSNAGSTLTETRTVSFTMPVVHGVRLISDPMEVTTTPGMPIQTALVIEARGNVAETVTFTVDPSAGLVVDGVQTVTVNPGQLEVLFLTLTPAAGTPLHSTLVATLTANFNGREPVTLRIPVQVAAPGVESVHRAVTSARELGNLDLANRLDDLAIALTNLTQQPASEVFKSQAVASLDSILTLLAVDPILVNYVDDLTAPRNALAAATTDAEVLAALDQLGTALDGFGDAIFYRSEYNFELFLLPNTQVALPQVPVEYELKLHHIGSSPATYNVSLPGLPASVTSQLSTTQVTLDRDEFASVFITLTQDLADELLAFNFTLDVSVEGFPEIAKSVVGSLTARNEFIGVVSVDAVPPFANPGTMIDVSTRLLNAVNRRQDALLSYEVFNSGGTSVFTSTPVAVELTVQTSLKTVVLGSLDTTGFALDNYRIVVTVSDLLGNPIPGAVGESALLIGSPVSATLNVGPQIVPPGTSTVTNTLEIESQTPILPALNVLGQAAAPGATDAVRNGDYLYVATPSGIRVYNIAGPNMNNPQLVTTVGPSTFSLEIRGNLLVAIQTTGVNASTFRLDTYSLTNPASPQPLGSTGNIPYGSSASMVVTDTHVFVVMVNFWFFANRDIFSQNGAVVAINIENPAAPFLDGDAVTLKGTPQGRDGVDDGVLFNEYGTSNDGVGVAGFDQSGGSRNTWDIVQVSPTIVLVTASSATGTDTQNGVGLVHVIDISDPRNMQLVRDVQIPGTVHGLGIAVEGNLALITATEGGIQDFSPTFPFVGNAVLAALDLTDPADPQLINRQELPDILANGISFDAALGGGLFAFGSRSESGNQTRLYLVDANNPENIVVSGIDVPAAIGGIRGGNNLIFTTDQSSLIIYEIVASPGIPVTATVRIPKGTNIAVVPGSFNIAPSQILIGPDFDTLVWNLALTTDTPSRTISWQTTVSGMQPGETRAVTGATKIDFTSQDTPGEITLPSQKVVVEQVLSLSPDVQTVQPGEAAAFTLTIKNPATTGVTYDLSITGLPEEWVNIVSQVFVPAGGSVDVPFTLTSNPFAPLAQHGFTVTATTAGVASSVEGTLVLVGEPLLPLTDPISNGVVVTLIPTQATAGQGTSTTYVARVTNTGSTSDSFVVFVSGLPADFTVTVDAGIFAVPPGTNNFRDVRFTITPPLNATATDYSFILTASSVTDALITDIDTGVLSVLNLGVNVDIVESSGPPNSAFQMVVTNTGQATETFDLAVAASAAIVATLGTSSVTLAPGASQAVSINVGVIDFALPGALPLVGIARSRTNNAVFDSDQASVTIAGRLDMTAAFEDDTVQISAPGPGSFLLLVDNLGNLEDQYVAQIIGTTGPVLANLIGLDGNPTQSIPLFILPSLSSGAIWLNSILTAFGTGTVTVQVKSLTDGSIVAEAVANLSALTTVETTTTVSSIAGTIYGDLFTFEAIVSAASGTPDGFVQFQIDGVDVGSPVALLGDTASFTTSATLNAGQHTITAVYAGNVEYFGSEGIAIQQVARAELIVTADNKSKMQNAPLPPLTASYSGFVNNDTPADLDTLPALSTTATTTSPAGDYPITVSGAAGANYTITFISGNLNVTPAITVGADVWLTSTRSHGSVVAGKNTVTYNFTIKNVGKMDATNVKVSFESVLPPGVSVKSVSVPQGSSFSGSFVDGTWKISKLKKNSSLTLSIILKIDSSAVPGVDVIQTTATAFFADQGLINTENDSTSQSTSIVTTADLAVTKHKAPSSVAAGGTIAYQVTIKNSGPGIAQNVKLIDLLPSGTTFVSQTQDSGPAFTLTNTLGQVTNTILALQSNASATFTIVVQVSTALKKNHKLTNQVTIISDSADPKSSNNSSTTETKVSKSSPGPSQNPGHDPFCRFDVDGDGKVNPKDILLLVDCLNRIARGHFLDWLLEPYFHDVNGDGSVSPADVLQIVSYLNMLARGAAGGLLSSIETSADSEEEPLVLSSELAYDIATGNDLQSSQAPAPGTGPSGLLIGSGSSWLNEINWKSEFAGVPAPASIADVIDHAADDRESYRRAFDLIFSEANEGLWLDAASELAIAGLGED